VAPHLAGEAHGGQGVVIRTLRAILEVAIAYWLFYALLTIPTIVQQVELAGRIADWSPLAVLIPGPSLLFLVYPPVIAFWLAYAIGRFTAPAALRRRPKARAQLLGVASGVVIATMVAYAMSNLELDTVVAAGIGVPWWVPFSLAIAAPAAWLLVFGRSLRRQKMPSPERSHPLPLQSAQKS
jgi:hypothetical protein